MTHDPVRSCQTALPPRPMSGSFPKSPDYALDVVADRRHRRSPIVRTIASIAVAVGMTIAAAAGADAATYLVEWEGWDFGYLPAGDAPPPINPPAPFDSISGSFQIELEPGEIVDETSVGLLSFETSFPVGSDFIYEVIPGGLALGGSEEGIGTFGSEDFFLYIFDFFVAPSIAGLGFSSGGDIFGARETSVQVTELDDAPAPVPLPAPALLLLGGLGGLVSLRRRRG